MTETALGSFDEHFLVLAPTGRDAALTHGLLARAGLQSVICRDMHELCMRARNQGAATLLIAEEVLVKPAIKLLSDTLDAQQSWSDLPILLFTTTADAGGPRPPLQEVIRSLGNVSLLDRPVRPITMISAAKSALRARRRQYLARAELAAQQRAVRQRDQFLAMLGHELRNPLSAIVMATELMDGEENVELRVLRRQASHLTRLVDDLLDVSRVTTGKAQLRCEDVDLDQLLRSCLEVLEPRAREQGVRLTYHAPKTSVLVHVDPVRCEQIITNLVTNAAKYTPPSGTIDLHLCSDEAQGQAIFRVQDSGEGISPEMLPHVFDLFAQAEGTLDRSRGGMGIGLTLVKSLVELHHGFVQAESAGLGKGSTFSVYLPLKASPAISPEESAKTAEASGPHTATHTRRACCDVLLVEDNPDSRELLSMLLERAGHRVQVAADGKDGLRQAFEAKPDVMLVDIGLPGMDGYAVAKKIRQDLGYDIFMIALTGYGQPEDRRRSIEAGFNEHLTKPVDVSALERLLSEAETRRGEALACSPGA